MQPVALTAFYCCALRAADAASARPVCGDTLAARFLDDDTRAQMAPSLAVARPAAANVARHRLIDDIVRTSLEEDPGRRIFVLGAGLDTRPFRLSGGRWWEFDDPALLAFKESRLPAATAPNPLVRTAVDLRNERLLDHLAPFAGHDHALVVLEGVSMYLPPSTLTDLASTVRARLPRARFVCDLMSPAFFRRYSGGLRRELARLGAEFAVHDKHPARAIEAAGYHPVDTVSIVGRARQAGTVNVPRWLLATFLRELRDGYAVWTFEP